MYLLIRISKYIDFRKGLNVDEELEKRKNRESERRKNLEDRIGNSTGEGLSHQLEIQLVSVNSQEYLSRCVEEYQLFKKYQESIHSVSLTSSFL